ncbi:MAG: ribonuclease III [Deltaproteobacteria bacterium]|nr:ribonuclease III [Deltaproteobacteria bacterium]
MDSSEQKPKLEKLCKTLGYTFNCPELLLQVFRHSSYVNERSDSGLEDNERLEFLGDAVLDLAVSHLLMDFFCTAEEGDLSKYRAMVVDESGLFSVAEKLQLGGCLFLGKGEEQSRGRNKPSILANTMEALLGALYLDAGFERTMEIIRKLFAPLLEKLGTRDMPLDFKSQLQEYTQKVHKALPIYRLSDEIGPAHDKTFRVALSLNGEVLAKGIGKSKKDAEQKAAREAYNCLKRDSDL